MNIIFYGKATLLFCTSPNAPWMYYFENTHSTYWTFKFGLELMWISIFIYFLKCRSSLRWIFTPLCRLVPQTPWWKFMNGWRHVGVQRSKVKVAVTSPQSHAGECDVSDGPQGKFLGEFNYSNANCDKIPHISHFAVGSMKSPSAASSMFEAVILLMSSCRWLSLGPCDQALHQSLYWQYCMDK